MRRWSLFWAGLAASAAATALLWWAGIPGAALLLAFPFFWLPRGRAGRSAASLRSCGQCGFSSHDPETRFCPRDGSPLT